MVSSTARPTLGRPSCGAAGPRAAPRAASPASESDAADGEISERSFNCQSLDDDWVEEESSEGFVPGTVMEAVSSVVMRSEARFASDFLGRLAPGEAVLVLEPGGLPTGSRLRVRALGGGLEGWVSAVASDGTELWSRLMPQDERQKQARLLYDPYARTYLVPEDFTCEWACFDFRGLWLEALRDTWLLEIGRRRTCGDARAAAPPAVSCTAEEKPTIIDRKWPLKANTLVQVTRWAQEGRRIHVRLTTNATGWVTVVFRGRYPVWRILPVDAGSGIGVYPYTPERWEALWRIERDSFGELEQRLQGWIAKAKSPAARIFIDVATTDGPDRVVGYCAWKAAPEDSTHDEECLEVLSIAVDMEFRGQRIGEKLINWVQRTGLRRFPDARFQSLHVRCDNDPAMKLYRRCGFKVICQIANYYGDQDAWYMVRELSGSQAMH